MTTHLIIPDVQTKKGVPTKHLKAAGALIVDYQPDVVVCLGDFADMFSLNSHSSTLEVEGKRVREDYDATHNSMEILLSNLNEYNALRKKNRKALYKPRMVMTMGNHENRIVRCIEQNPKLKGLLSLDDLKYKEFGWEVYPFLGSVAVNGIHYSHYFYSKLSGRPHPNSRLTLAREHVSCTQGHAQVFDYDMQYTGDGKCIVGLRAGAFYMHDEEYKGIQGNNHWRGVIVKHNVNDGMYDMELYSIDRLLKEYS